MLFQVNEIMLNKERNVKLTSMLQSVSEDLGKIKKRPAVLIFPGGAYAVCSDREAEVVAYPYLQAGFQAFVLRYSVGEYKAWPNPMEDYEQTMELIKEKEDEWNVMTDKIAVIGFSAGGHLAATAATCAKTRPNAAIIGYGALTQEIVDFCGPNMPYPVDCVDADTCPCFLFAARDDSAVPVYNTIDFERALYNYSISFEAHIYAYGEHGFSTGESNMAITDMCSRVPHWVKDSIDWLYDVFGTWNTEGLNKPKCSAKLDGNAEEFLSLDCTIDYLRKQGKAAHQVLSGAFAAVEAVARERFGNEESGKLVLAALKNMNFRNLLILIGQPEESIAAIDAALCKIPNEKMKT